MSIQQETFAGGIDTTQDPALLEPGVHQAISNLIYTQDSDTLMLMPGRAQWKDVGGGDPIVGLLAASFDNGVNYIVTSDGTTRKVYNASSGATTATATETATTIGGVQYDNRYFMYDGHNTPTMLLQDGTTRQVGLTPITESIAALATAAGSWLGIATGYFDYWVTEVAKLTTSAETADPAAPYELECAYSADPQTIKVENLQTRVAIKLPAVVTNANATHFRVYRAGPKNTVDSEEFPIGEQVVMDTEVAAVGTTVYDGSATSTALAFGSNATDGTITSWVNPGNVYATDTTYAVQATAVGGANALARCSNIYSLSAALATAIKDPIVGLQIDVIWAIQTNSTSTAQSKDPGSIKVSVTFDNGTTWHGAAAQGERNTTVGATGTYIYGGPEALWTKANLSRTDFDTATFKVRVEVSAVNGGLTWAPKVAIDSVIPTLFYNGAGLETYRQYNAIVIESQGQQVAFSAAGSPPISSIATVFEGAIVSNNVDKPSWIQYSQAGAVEYWPELYFLNFETDDRDEVTYLGTVNNKLIVGLAGAIYRVNYLPTEEDADGRRGLAYERISRTHGIVNTKSACMFQGLDGRELLAFVSHNGVFATDGYTITKLSQRLNWRTLVGVDIIDDVSIALVNDPDLGLLWFHTINGTYALHYLGRLRWTGPHIFNNADPAATLTTAITARKANGSFHSYLGYSDGTVWRTDQLFMLGGTWMPVNSYTAAGGTITTRRIAPATPIGEGTLATLWIYGGAIPGEVEFATRLNYWKNSSEPILYETMTGTSDWTFMAPVKLSPATVSGTSVTITITLGADTFTPLQSLYLDWAEVKEANLA